MLPQPAMVLDDTVLVGKMIEDMGMDDVRLSVVLLEIQARRKARVAVANDKARGIVAASDPLKKIELGTRSSEKKKKKVELGTRSSELGVWVTPIEDGMCYFWF
ncbi:hypothetical protein AMTRI_Chr09g15490 [Amborella trichopoda]